MKGVFEMENKQSQKKPGPKKPGPGRPKGSPNKITATLKEAILAAAEQAGGPGGTTAYLLKQARTNPNGFLPLLGKVLPLQVQHEGAIKIEAVQIKFVDDENDDS